jgi:hypothetical protein
LITAFAFAEQSSIAVPRYAGLSILLLLILKAGLSNSKEDAEEILNSD